ncbi:PREDICTED: zinc finger CCCH domain-containing protein 13 isoform X1 [Eufriesea mexicana]|uniref:zinc finger CCCH domain-containing protein 13 isoform X1 n=1 Tax=Eufriesea mexicana TaxID=516756 RepID=UPI00083C70E3|nr:PREDICTED: zinc finger CCCH domain-containing protein 13 isoform X1 [Eufriesea mexicana]XP_017761529.1 PREDICTED: zinc finger CCCH domain-containing protein 13 isoform X1 [Eufriesea mexicana]
MREKRWLLLALYGILLINVASAERKPTRPKFKIATTSTTTSSTTEESHVRENENEDAEATTAVVPETNGTSGHVLTGIPQIDYIWDPNLPRELNGYNLSDYPFYNSIPEDIDFKCDGLHDGFYASVPHKCQVYHHCLFGTRYDFLCANFTAFDQKTFICHFVSEVDCANSKKYWHRNDALYKATTTSTTSTSTTTLAPVTAATGRQSSRDRDHPRRRRPFRRRPAYDYYDEEYYDDDYSRPRGYSRDDYDYDDRKYRRDRDRDFRDRDRDFRDRDSPRSRDGAPRDDRDRDVNARDRYPSRNNRRDPTRVRDPLEDDTRVRSRDSDQGLRSASREIDDAEVDDRRTESRIRDPDDRRYSDKRYRDDYEDKDPASASAGASTSSEGLVKPAAPATSVYARPRAPPKIRRPVPLSEQDKYAYKATAVQSTEEPRRRPVDVADDDYYEDELEDLRPVRRPLRRRPTYRDRDRDRDFYDVVERDRGRPFRPRYRDDEDDLRPRKHSDRSRDRYYDRDRDRGVERGRDRSLDRGKDRNADRSLDRDRGRMQDAEKSERPHRPLDKDRDIDRPRSGSRSKDLQETTDAPSRRGSNYDRTERTTTTTTTTTTCLPEQFVHKTESTSKESLNDKQTFTERPSKSAPNQTTRTPIEDGVSHRTNQQTDYQERDQDEKRERGQYQTTSIEEYSQDYYDEPEDPPAPPPRTTVRIVKRPFLPSRGGNPNPRGLSPVGAKATTPKKEEDKSTERTTNQERSKNYYVHETMQENSRESNQEVKTQQEQKESYDAYKHIQNQNQNQNQNQHEYRHDEYDTSIARPAIRRPTDRQREEETQKSIDDAFVRGSKQEQSNNGQNFDEGLAKWSTDEFSNPTQGNEGNVQASGSSFRNKGRLTTNENPSVYGSTFKNDEAQEQPTGPQNFRVKQRLNEVTHRLQDIPESEYDVTLNDALTPTLNQETNLPSGFVLPLHRQLGRDAVLQSSENNYKVSRPVTQQQQKPFVPNPQFLPTVNTNDRLRTVYYRTPEAVQINGAQYRPQRGSWHDYTGY